MDLKKILKPFGNPKKFLETFPNYIKFLQDYSRYSKLRGSEKIKKIFPQLHDSHESNPIDSDYFYQDTWAFKKIYNSGAKNHTDVASMATFVGYLTSFAKVTYIDIRDLKLNLENYKFKKGSITSLPYEDNSIDSLSCLSVAEHIGLGRYGDRLDPKGTQKGCKELQRILAKGGNLYFALPIGKPKVLFNAHRVHSVEQILKYFDELKLIEFSYTDSKGNFIQNVDPRSLDLSQDVNGLFHFTK